MLVYYLIKKLNKPLILLSRLTGDNRYKIYDPKTSTFEQDIIIFQNILARLFIIFCGIGLSYYIATTYNIFNNIIRALRYISYSFNKDINKNQHQVLDNNFIPGFFGNLGINDTTLFNKSLEEKKKLAIKQIINIFTGLKDDNNIVTPVNISKIVFDLFNKDIEILNSEDINALLYALDVRIFKESVILDIFNTIRLLFSEIKNKAAARAETIVFTSNERAIMEEANIIVKKLQEQQNTAVFNDLKKLLKEGYIKLKDFSLNNFKNRTDISNIKILGKKIGKKNYNSLEYNNTILP